LLKFIIVN